MHLRRRSLEDCLNERPPDDHERQELNLKRAELSTGPSALFRTNPDDEHQLTIDGNPWIQNPAAEALHCRHQPSLRTIAAVATCVNASGHAAEIAHSVSYSP